MLERIFDPSPENNTVQFYGYWSAKPCRAMAFATGIRSLTLKHNITIEVSALIFGGCLVYHTHHFHA